GEPCAGEPHARFGGRGGLKPVPTPIQILSHRLATNLQHHPIHFGRCGSRKALTSILPIHFGDLRTAEQDAGDTPGVPLSEVHLNLAAIRPMTRNKPAGPARETARFRGNPARFRQNPARFCHNPVEFHQNPIEFRHEPARLRHNPLLFRQ
ncbi:MAG: hypothetical protein BECKG1743F_GA0114225_110712, partial [Candidatus Kentron sp. G]